MEGGNTLNKLVVVWGGADYMGDTEGGGFHHGSGDLYPVACITIVTEIHLYYFIPDPSRTAAPLQWTASCSVHV